MVPENTVLYWVKGLLSLTPSVILRRFSPISPLLPSALSAFQVGKRGCPCSSVSHLYTGVAVNNAVNFQHCQQGMQARLERVQCVGIVRRCSDSERAGAIH
jgi:hypothetical protein